MISRWTEGSFGSVTIFGGLDSHPGLVFFLYIFQQRGRVAIRIWDLVRFRLRLMDQVGQSVILTGDQISQEPGTLPSW